MKKSRRATDAISGLRRKPSGCSTVGCALFSLPWFLAGAAVIYLLGVGPALKILKASGWNATPCVVTSSKVGTGSEGDTFGVEIHYSYTVDGKQYEGTRYDFIENYSSGYDGKAKIVGQNPVGKNATCYVNPSDPKSTVFYRGFSWEMMWGLFGVPFLLVGAVGLFLTARFYIEERKSRTEVNPKPLGSWPSFDAMHSPSSSPAIQSSVSFQPVQPYLVSTPATSAAPAPFGRVVLEPAMTPARKLILLTFVALFWNGIVSVFVFVLIKEWSRGDVEWVLALFLTPFVLIGILLLFAVAHTFLALFNPRPRITIDSRQLSPGESFDLDWQFSGSTGRVKQLRIYLEGREEATYRRGTDTSTDKNVFATIEIANKPNADPGRAQVKIPGNTMHSFKSDHNKIVWEIHVQGDIRYWADVDESFEIEVLPKKSPRTAEL